VLRDIEHDPVRILELALGVSLPLVAEIEEECSGGCLDASLRFGKIIDLEAKMVGADCLGRIPFDVVSSAAGKSSTTRD